MILQLKSLLLMLLCIWCMFQSCVVGGISRNPLGDWSPPMEWGLYDIPDPQVDTWKCGRGGNKSFVCNPDHVLTDQQVYKLDDKINELATSTGPCKCSNCDFKTGCQLTVVAVKNIKMNYVGNEQKKYRFSQYTYYLRCRKYKQGKCNDNILILLVTQDKMIYTSTGAVVSPVLTNHCVDEIYEARKHYFTNKIWSTGLDLMIHDYLEVFSGDHSCIDSDDGRNYSSMILGVKGCIFLLCVVGGIYLIATFKDADWCPCRKKVTTRPRGGHYSPDLQRATPSHTSDSTSRMERPTTRSSTPRRSSPRTSSPRSASPIRYGGGGSSYRSPSPGSYSCGGGGGWGGGGGGSF